ncbi:MAG: VOC family protein [Lactovum sp.]
MIKPYILFNRNCDEAVNMYVKAFDGEIISMQKYSDMPENPDFPITEDMKNLVIHSCIKLTEEGYIFASDSQQDYPASEKVVISLQLDSEEKARKAWDILKIDGKVHMELAPAFFSDLHGSVQDKYGVTWMFTVGQR